MTETPRNDTPLRNTHPLCSWNSFLLFKILNSRLVKIPND